MLLASGVVLIVGSLPSWELGNSRGVVLLAGVKDESGGPIVVPGVGVINGEAAELEREIREEARAERALALAWFVDACLSYGLFFLFILGAFLLLGVIA